MTAPLDRRALPRPRVTDPACPHCDLSVPPAFWDRHLKFRCPVLNEKRGPG